MHKTPKASLFSGRLSKVVCTLAAMVLSLGTISAQQTITGVVSDNTGAPLTGASVVVEGVTPSVGTITDLDGKYTLAVPADCQTLVYSFIGMSDVTESINGRTVINVVLEPVLNELNSVVVTALGISKSEKSLSYNVQQTELENINPSNSFVTALNGKVAGVTINSSSSGIGGASRVVMRGTKSISGNNNALYVIDGIPMPALTSDQPSGVFEGAGQTGDGLSSINPDDIESISVLSGPSAAALYGSSAANGVVMITTKKGGKDKFELNYTNSTSFSRAYIMPSFQNIYGTTEKGSYQSWGERLAAPASYSPRNFFQTGVNESNAISVSTGNGKNQTYLSLAATNSEGIIHGNNYDRYNMSARNTSSFLQDKMTLDVNFMYSYVKEENMISQGQYMNPVLPVYLFPAAEDFSRLQIYERYDASRNMKVQYWPYESDLSMQNPYWVTEKDKFINAKHRVMTSAQLKYQIADWISISGRAKIDRTTEVHEKKFAASTNELFASKYGYYSKNDVATQQIYAEALLNINKYFVNDKLSLTATLGTNIEDVVYGQEMFGGNLASVSNLYTFSNVAKATASFNQSGYRKQKQAIFLNAQIGWDNMVYLDVTGRNDWSSTLAGSQYKSFFYPTVGLSAILTEAFDIKCNFLKYWKIRASYSEVGNDPDVFLTIPTFAMASGTPITMTRMPNTNLQPERTKSWEIGTNIYVFNGKLKIDATYYKSSTYNQFFESALSSTTGYSSVIVNAGRVDNSGVELSARLSNDFCNNQFHWDTYLTYSHNTNKIVELLNNWKNPITGEMISMTEMEVGGTAGVKNILKEGGSMGAIYVTSLKTDEHGAIFVHPTAQTVSADYNNYIYAGDTAPKHNLSWGNDFSYRGFSLSFLFTARIGGVVVSKTQQVMDYYGISQASADARLAGGALINGKRIPAKEYYQTIGAGTGVMSQYVYDATNIRLGELSFGYSFPVQNWCKWVKGVNLSFVAHNLCMIYKKAPFDPELTANTGTYNQGIDYFMQPSTRNLGFSVKLKF